MGGVGLYRGCPGGFPLHPLDCVRRYIVRMYFFHSFQPGRVPCHGVGRCYPGLGSVPIAILCGVWDPLGVLWVGDLRGGVWSHIVVHIPLSTEAPFLGLRSRLRSVRYPRKLGERAQRQ